MTEDIKIIKATYGSENKFIDVTDKFIEIFTKNKQVHVINDNFTDPHPGVVKQLILTYIQNGKERTKTKTEGEHFIIEQEFDFIKKLKDIKVYEQGVYDFVKTHHDDNLELVINHIVIIIYNHTNKTAIIAGRQNPNAGLYCYVNYYISVISTVKTLNYKLLNIFIKDGWILYNETDRYLYNELFTQDLTKHSLLTQYFAPSNNVINTINKLKNNYNINPEKTIGVCYRGTDKKTEVRLPNPEDFINKCKSLISDDIKILIQTDEQPVSDMFVKEFGDKCIIVKEIPMSSNGKNVFHKKLDGKIDICIYLDSVMRIISECKYVVTNSSGNMTGMISQYRCNSTDLYYIEPRNETIEFLEKFKNIKLQYNNYKNHKIINVYKNKFTGMNIGIGDFLKGSTSLFDIFSDTECDIKLDISRHSISNYIIQNSELFFTSCVDEQNIKEYTIGTEPVHMFNEILKFPKNNCTLFVSTNFKLYDQYNRSITEYTKCKLKHFFNFTTEINNYYFNFINKNGLQLKEYEILDIRIDDNCYKIEINSDRLARIYKLIENLHIPKDTKIVVISNSTYVKKLICEKFNFIDCAIDTMGHTGSENVDDVSKGIINKLNLLKNSKKIYSYSDYWQWLSGFSNYTSLIFDIPIKFIHL